MRACLSFLICIAALSLSSCADAAPVSYVRVLTATANATIRSGIEQNTSLEAIRRVTLYPKVTGRLEKLHVQKGANVTLNQVLAVLSHDEQDAQIASTKAQILSARAEEDRTKAEMDNARIELERYQRLNKEGFSTQQQLEDKDTAFRSAKALYDAARARRSELRAELRRVEAAHDEYIITAPIEGTVLNDYSLSAGAMVSPSTPVLELADLQHLKAVLSLPETRLYSIHEGMPVRLTLDALPQDVFMGTIIHIDAYVDPSTRTANVEVGLSNPSGNLLRPGMFGRAFIVDQEAENALVIPMPALRHEREGPAVVVVRDNKAHLTPVKTGIRQGNSIQILEGVKPGDQVIVFGGSSLRNGDPVEIVP